MSSRTPCWASSHWCERCTSRCWTASASDGRRWSKSRSRRACATSPTSAATRQSSKWASAAAPTARTSSTRSASPCITNIEYEHRERLGWTLTSIAREKAAIIRGGEIAVVGALRPEALAVIAARCAEVGATLWRMGREVRVTHRRSDGDGIDLRCADSARRDARTARAAARRAPGDERGAGRCGGAGVLRRERRRHRGVCAIGTGGGAAERPAGVHAGVAPRAARRRAQPGRGATPRPHAARAAGCATAGGCTSCAASSPTRIRQRWCARWPVVATRVIVTQPPSVERAGDPERMLAHFRKALGDDAVTFEPDPQRAVDRALDDAALGDTVCVTGSMYPHRRRARALGAGRADPRTSLRGAVGAGLAPPACSTLDRRRSQQTSAASASLR